MAGIVIMGIMSSALKKCCNGLFGKRLGRPYVLPMPIQSPDLTPLPSPPISMDLQTLEHQLSSLHRPARHTCPPSTSFTVDRRNMYKGDVDKRRASARDFLPGYNEYLNVGGVLVLSYSLRTS